MSGHATRLYWGDLKPAEPSEFAQFQRIRLKHINKMLEQCEKRPEEVVAVATVLLTAEKKAIEEFLGEK